ncbi:MAG: hypothetical protein KAI24_01940, partial [Planctomycetes bacterium]|nr:hypothetical protein [Planctomycetota bacterium]
EPDVPGLVAVLETDWQGSLPAYGMFGGGYGGRFEPREPRRVVLHDARESLVKLQTSPLSWYWGPERLDELVVPHHPHDLARLVLQQHPDARSDAAPTPTTIERARVWLQLGAPDDAKFQRACLNDEIAEILVTALWLRGDDGRARLRRMLPGSNAHLQRAAALLGQPELFDSPELVDVVVQQLVTAKKSADRQQAGWLLLQLKEAAALPLARACGDDRIPRSRAAGVLALLGEDATPAAETLIRIADSDRVTRRRALVALSNVQIPAPLKARAAQVAWRVYETRDQTSKLLALDALGNCGLGVDAGMRAQLVEALDDPPFGGTKARILGCLRDLCLATDLTVAQKAYIASTVHPTTSTYLALADEGAAAKDELRRLLLDPAEGVDAVAVARETPLALLRAWLDASDPKLRHLAYHGLVHRDSAHVSDDQLLQLLTSTPALADDCLTMFTYRPDAGMRLAPQVIAHLVERAADSTWLSRAAIRYLTDNGLPAAQKLTMYAPLLRRGLALDTVDAEVLRPDLERWLDETEDAKVRARLLSGLCRIGLRRHRDIALAVDALGGEHRNAVLLHLDGSPDLPAPLREALVAILDEPEDEDGMPNGDAWYARKILLKHRQR